MFHNTQIYVFLRICIAKRSELISQYHHLLSNSIRSSPTFTLLQVAWASPKYAMHSSPYMIHDTAFFQRNLMISQYYVDTQEAALLHESQHIPDAILQVQRKTFANIFTNRQSSVACRKCVPVEVADDGSEQKIQAGKSHRGFGNGSWFRTDSAN